MADILIVDDDPSIRETLQALLERLGHTVTAAVNGLDGVQCFDAGRFDLVVSDVMMPEMNGFDFLQALQSRILDRVPFIILSSHDDREGIKAALFAGAFDYILKPFDETRVKEVLDRALSQRSSWSSGGGVPARQAPVTFAAPPQPASGSQQAGPDALARTTKVVSVTSPREARTPEDGKRPRRWLRSLLRKR